MGNHTPKDNNAVVLSVEVRKIIEDGGAMILPIRLEDICYKSNSGQKSKNGEFQNPRMRKGFDPESMRELAETIASDGLLKNLLVRQVDRPSGTVYEIVAGERRTRAIRALVEEDRLVKNQRTGRMEQASKVYETVSCLVQGGCDDRMATRLAFLENDSHIPLSDADVIDLCFLLEDQGYTRKEIADLLGKSQAWLSHTFGFAKNLTTQNYERLRSGEINRSVAVKLMDYDRELQSPILEAAMAKAEDRHEKTFKEVEEKLESAVDAQDQAFRDQQNLKRRGVSDERTKRTAEQKVERAEKLVAKLIAERRQQVARSRPSPSQSDIAEGAFAVAGAAHGNRNLTSSQIREHFIDRAKNLLAVSDGDPLDTKTGGSFLRRDVELVVVVADAIATGSRDLSSILRDFYKNSGSPQFAQPTLRSSKEEDSDPEDEEEDEDDLVDFDFNLDDEDGVPALSGVSVFSGLDLSTLGDEDEE